MELWDIVQLYSLSHVESWPVLSLLVVIDRIYEARMMQQNMTALQIMLSLVVSSLNKYP